MATFNDVVNAVNLNSQIFIVSIYVLAFALGLIAGGQR